MTIEQKMAKGMLTIRGIRSFYYTIYYKRIETKEVQQWEISRHTLLQSRLRRGIKSGRVRFIEIRGLSLG